MRKKLAFQALVKYILGMILVATLLFPAAGTLRYWNGWLLMGLLFLPMFFVGVILLWKNPTLLEKRLKNKEEQSQQKTVILFSAVLFIAGFIVSGLDHRFGWSRLSPAFTAAGSVLLLVSFALYGEVLRENAYLSRSVEIQKGQKLVDTGLYSVVRHPMYLVTILLFLSFPMVLGSAYGFTLFLLYPVLLIRRIKNEEEVLLEGLAGYREYMERVPCRLIPYIW